MPKNEDKVMALVERELKKNPDADTQELHDKAVKADAAVKKLTLRQFNARYPLQVKRRLAPKKPRRRKAANSKTGSSAPRRRRRPKAEMKRSRVRDVFLRFAKDLVEAEGKYEAIDVIAGVDRYVDEVLDT